MDAMLCLLNFPCKSQEPGAIIYITSAKDLSTKRMHGRSILHYGQSFVVPNQNNAITDKTSKNRETMTSYMTRHALK